MFAVAMGAVAVSWDSFPFSPFHVLIGRVAAMLIDFQCCSVV